MVPKPRESLPQALAIIIITTTSSSSRQHQDPITQRNSSTRDAFGLQQAGQRGPGSQLAEQVQGLQGCSNR